MTPDPTREDERRRRWYLALGLDDDKAARKVPLSDQDRRLDQALSAVYGNDRKGKRGSLQGSAPKVARWLGDIREFFPSPVVQVIQKDAVERLGLEHMLHDAEFLATLEADVHLVSTLISLGGAMPETTRETARLVVAKVVEDLVRRLELRTVEAVSGALRRGKRSRRPRFADIDWDATIRANLRHYSPATQTLAIERVIGHGRSRRADLEDVILCVDQSGSMAPSVVYASIFAAIMASLPAVTTKFVAFDTAIVDLTEDLADPVSVLFGVQLGGGTDINQALAYCQTLVDRPEETTLVLISDLYEGGNAEQMLQRAAALVRAGVSVIVLLALSDEGRPAYHDRHAQAFAALGAPVFACTPDLFSEMMAAALRKDDLSDWAAAHDVVLVR